MTLSNRQTDKNFLLFESQISQDLAVEKWSPVHSERYHWVWSDWLVLIQTKEDNKFWNFTALDLLMNESRPIRFRKSDDKFRNIEVYPLDSEFGFIVEESANIQRVNVVKIDWNTDEFELIEKFDFECRRLFIFIDKMNASKFMLKWLQNDGTFNYQLGKLNNGKVEFGESYQIQGRFGIYSKDRLIKIDISYQGSASACVYDLISKKEETFEIEKSQENIGLRGLYEWVNDRFYVSVEFLDTKKYGIAWTTLETKRWTYLNFETDLEIEKLKFFNNNLFVNTNCFRVNNETIYFSEVKFFNIPMRKPTPLRQSAWLCVVQMMKNKEEEDPYKSAKEFLPLNSDLREYWFRDEEMKMKIKEN